MTFETDPGQLWAIAPASSTSIDVDMPEDMYHAHYALSCSRAKVLLDCPAKFLYELTAPPVHKDYFDIGSAAHKLVLGAGPEIVVVDVDDWRTKAAQEAKKAAHAAGQIPVKRDTYRQVVAMADAMRAHPTVAALLSQGRPEVSMFWSENGVPLRCRPDWLFERDRLIAVDAKTTTDASPWAFARTAASLRYHMQAAWYRAGIAAVLDAPAPPFVFVAQEKEPPYLTGVYELDAEALNVGRSLMRRAIDIWRRCVEADEWPSYPAAVLSLPRWATNPTTSEED